MPTETVVGHRQAAELGDDVVAGGELCDALGPLVEDLVAPAGVHADAERGAEVVEHHRGVGHGPGELEHLGVLMVVVPRVVGEVAAAELSNALPERLVGEASWIGPPGNHQQLRFEGARQGVADALEQVAGCCLVRVEHLLRAGGRGRGRRGRRCRRSEPPRDDDGPSRLPERSRTRSRRPVACGAGPSGR